MAHLDAASHHAMNHTPAKYSAPQVPEAMVKDAAGKSATADAASQQAAQNPTPSTHHAAAKAHWVAAVAHHDITKIRTGERDPEPEVKTLEHQKKTDEHFAAYRKLQEPSGKANVSLAEAIVTTAANWSEDQARDPSGRWESGGGSPIGKTSSGKSIPAHDADVYRVGEKRPKWNGTVSPRQDATEGGRMLRERLQGWTAKDHEEAAAAHQAASKSKNAEWQATLEKAHQETFGKKPGVGDYKISAIGRDEYSDERKNQARELAHAATHHSDAAWAHWRAAGHHTLPLPNADLASVGVGGASGAGSSAPAGGALSQPILGDSARAVPGSGPASARLEEAQFKRKVKGEQADPKLCSSGTGACSVPNKDQLDARAIHLGALAHKDFKAGKNPAGWAVDEDIWDKAKDAALKSYSVDDDAYWPVVAHIYENMGGTIKGEGKKANVSLSTAIIAAVANDYHPDQARDEGGRWTGEGGDRDRASASRATAFTATDKAVVLGGKATMAGTRHLHALAAESHQDAAKAHRTAADHAHIIGNENNANQHRGMADWHDETAKRHDRARALAPRDDLRPGDTGNELVGQYYGGKDISNARLANAVLALANVAEDEVALTLADIPADAPSLANAEAATDGWLRLAPFGDHPHPGLPGANEPVVQRFDHASAQAVLDGFRSGWGKFKRALIGLPIFNGHPDVPGLQHLFKDKGPKGTASDMRIGEDGLYIRPALNPDGARVVEGGSDRPSPYWNCRRTGEKTADGRPIVSPFQLISVGLVPRGNIAGPSLMNAATANSNHQDSRTTMNNERTLLIQLLTALGQTVSPQVGDTDLANAVQTAIAALPKKDVAEAANALLVVLRGAKLDDKGKLETFLANANLKATELATANTAAQSAAATITTLTTERDAARTEATAAKATATSERLAHSELLANAAVEAGLIPGTERDAWVTALANATDFSAKAKELTTKKPAVKTTSVAMRLGNVKAGAAAEKSAAKKIQEGVQAIMKAHGLTYLAAYANFQSDPANRELFAGLKSDEVKVPNGRR